ncbi:MAG: shikimate dehydrogenase [Candidatus Omnitrophica bacterium]|nr:shikimate dehydrogenase [Candidatus Omnitrophota bacterium]
MKQYKLFGIIGFPIKHTLSPYMHNAAFNKLKIAAAYLPFEVKKAKLKEAISSLKENGLSGFNVTIPFKSACMKYLDKIEPTSKAIGAVNTVIVKGKKLIGYNTDYTGFIRSLKEELKFKPKGKTIFIVGAGGAARAACFGLAKEGAKKIYAYDIIKPKAKELVKGAKRVFRNCDIDVCSKKDVKDAICDSDLLVNCTPLGMGKSDPLPIDIKFLHKGIKVYDVVYTPLETKLIKLSKQKGIKACGGAGMLLYQGVVAFELWTKKKAPVTLMRKALLDNLK